MASSDSQTDKPQRGRPKRAELPDVNINTGAQSINAERASLIKRTQCADFVKYTMHLVDKHTRKRTIMSLLQSVHTDGHVVIERASQRITSGGDGYGLQSGFHSLAHEKFINYSLVRRIRLLSRQHIYSSNYSDINDSLLFLLFDGDLHKAAAKQVNHKPSVCVRHFQVGRGLSVRWLCT